MDGTLSRRESIVTELNALICKVEKNNTFARAKIHGLDLDWGEHALDHK